MSYLFDTKGGNVGLSAIDDNKVIVLLRHGLEDTNCKLKDVLSLFIERFVEESIQEEFADVTSNKTIFNTIHPVGYRSETNNHTVYTILTNSSDFITTSNANLLNTDYSELYAKFGGSINNRYQDTSITNFLATGGYLASYNQTYESNLENYSTYNEESNDVWKQRIAQHEHYLTGSSDFGVKYLFESCITTKLTEEVYNTIKNNTSVSRVSDSNFTYALRDSVEYPLSGTVTHTHQVYKPLKTIVDVDLRDDLYQFYYQQGTILDQVIYFTARYETLLIHAGISCVNQNVDTMLDNLRGNYTSFDESTSYYYQKPISYAVIKLIKVKS